MSIYTVLTGWIPARVVFAALICWGAVAGVFLQMNLNLTIVAMVNQTAVQKSVRMSPECYDRNTQDQESIHNTQSGELVWSQSLQGAVLGSIFVGFLGTRTLGGMLTRRFGSKNLILFSITIPSVLALLTPTATRIGGASLLCLLRMVQGLALGIMGPAAFAMVALWSPVLERSLIISLSYMGNMLGTAIILILSGYITAYNLLTGWTSVFYLTGAFGCVFSLFWYLLAHDEPSHHPSISNEELSYIHKSLQEEGPSTAIRSGVPWLSVVTSASFWSLLAVRFSCNWGVVTLQTALPLYLQTALYLPIELNGLMNGVIYLSSMVTSVVAGGVADAVRKRTRLSTTTTRKIFATIAYVGGAACWFSIASAGCKIGLVFVLIVSVKVFMTLTVAADYVTVVDMAPQFAGPLSGIIYTITDTTGFLSPLATGIITEQDVTLERWSYVFWLSAVVLLVGLVQFLVFGSAEVQPWARGQETVQDNPEARLTDVKPPPYKSLSYEN